MHQKTIDEYITRYGERLVLHWLRFAELRYKKSKKPKKRLIKLTETQAEKVKMALLK